jgi:hypothetical protein
MQGTDEASHQLGKHPGVAAKRCGAVALPCANKRYGGIVRVDDFAVGQRLAWRASSGLVLNPLLGCPSQGQDLRSQRQQACLRLAYQRHTYVSHPPELAAEAAHQRLEVGLGWLGLRLQRRTLGGALRRDRTDELEDFVGAFYRVAASWTRGLPGARGTVSTTRRAGLTSPASMAAAAWIARRSSINGASSRRRT